MNLAVVFAQVLQKFGIEHKILLVTCDNASNNDMMVSELEMKLTHFSSVNHTRCFAHILNLVAKSLLKQFDVKQDPGKNDNLDEDEQTLLAMAENLEEEELIMAQKNNGEDGSGEDNDSLDGWVDEVEALTLEEHKNLEESIWPVKRMLVKVTKVLNVLTCRS